MRAKWLNLNYIKAIKILGSTLVYSTLLIRGRLNLLYRCEEKNIFICRNGHYCIGGRYVE